jgi:hypothetical protein
MHVYEDYVWLTHVSSDLTVENRHQSIINDAFNLFPYEVPKHL